MNEIVKPKSRAKEQQIFEQLDVQAALIAERCKLPTPEPEALPNIRTLAAALTKIEVANYEAASGEAVSDRVFEVLVEENLSRAAAPPLSGQIERMRESFGGTAVEANLKSASALEAATLNALLDPVRCGFNAATVVQAQRYVRANEAAAREVATLIQIAYGGQNDRFTEQFKTDLSEHIFYASKPATDTYRQFSQFDWQTITEKFKPLVDELAEQHKIEIKLPGDDAERDVMLAEFAARQLINAAAAQNQPMEPYVQTYLLQSFVNAGKLDVAQQQKETIAGGMDDNLEPPEFSSQLEASIYNLTKYDDAKKAEVAIKTAATIRGQVQARE